MPSGVYPRKCVPPIERIESRSVQLDLGYKTPCSVFPNVRLDRHGVTNIWDDVIGDWRQVGTHRVVYEHHHGPLALGYEPDHLCRIPACHEISHLEAVTRKENMLRGTNSRMAAHAAGTCEKSHPMSGVNLYVSPRGQRQCRICRRERQRSKTKR